MPYDTRGDFERAWDRGTSDVKSSAGGFINWFGDMTGNEELVKKGKAITVKERALSGSSERAIASFKDVNNFKDGLTYAVETFGEMAPSLIFDALATAATVATGGAAGAVVAIARTSAKEAIKSGMKKGLISGPAASGFIQSVGNMENTLEEKGSEVNTGAAFASGVAGAATNTLPFALAIPRLKAAGISDEVVEGIGNRFKDVMKTTGITGGAEGAASVTQEIIDKVIENKALGETTDLADFATLEFVDNAIRSVIGGGAAGGAASIAAHTGGKVIKEYNIAAEEALAESYNSGKEGFIPEKEEFEAETQAEAVVAETETEEFKNDSFENQSAEGNQGNGISAADIPDLSEQGNMGNYDIINRMATDEQGETLPWTEFKKNIDEYNRGASPQEAVTNSIIAMYVADSFHRIPSYIPGKINEGKYGEMLKQLLSEFRGVKEGNQIVSQAHLDYLHKSDSTFKQDLQKLVRNKGTTIAEMDAFVEEHKLFKVAQHARKNAFYADGKAMYIEAFGTTDKSKSVSERRASEPTVKRESEVTGSDNEASSVSRSETAKVKSVDGDARIDPVLVDQADADSAKKG